MEHTVSLADLRAPTGARAACRSAQRHIDDGRLVEAEASLRKALEIYPEYPAARYLLGRLAQLRGQHAEARAAYHGALEVDPKSWRSWAGLAEIARTERNWLDLDVASGNGLRLMPVSAQLLGHSALAAYHLGRPDDAEASALRAIDGVDQEQAVHATAHHVLGLIAAGREAYDAAIEHLERSLKLEPESDDAASIRQRLERIRERSS